MFYDEAYFMLLSKVRKAIFPGVDGAGSRQESTFSSYDEKML